MTGETAECGWCAQRIVWEPYPVAAYATLDGRLRCTVAEELHLPAQYLPVMTEGWLRLLAAMERVTAEQRGSLST